MAELNVQPKKQTSYLPWILLVLGIAALIWFLTRDKGDKDVVTRDTVADTVATTTTATTMAIADWNNIDFNAPALMYDEITDKNINVRGNNNYGIYGLGENVLFDKGQAAIRPDAEANLKQIVGSIDKRYVSSEVRVYGFTDAQGTGSTNKKLARERAEAVKAWLQNNGIADGRMSVNAVGEGQPAASNNTEEGQQQNRRVEIVARGGISTK